MKCVNHGEMEAVALCAGCEKPLCSYCIESQDENGNCYCFDCAISLNLSDFQGREKKFQAEEEKRKAKKGRLSGKVIVALITAAVLIVGEGAFILYTKFAQKKSAPTVTAEQEIVWERDECIMNMQKVREALAAYHAGNNQQYPPSLYEITGSYFKGEPVCPKTKAPYSYENLGTDYRLSCPNPDVHSAAEISSSAEEVPHFSP
ncbi:MAG: hypothetical protein JXA49_06230 [Actinobacteria bacterium]|nr:hypothetical protein [Actinomycetota bacterium]